MTDRLAAALSAHLRYLHRGSATLEETATFDTREEAEEAAQSLRKSVGGTWLVSVHWDIDHENGEDSRAEAWTVVCGPN